MDILFTPDLIHTEPAYIAAIAANAGKQLTANIESAFGTFTNQSGSRLSSLGYSGAAYDSVRGRVMHMGEGHQDGNGNAVYGLTLWDTETPAWTRFKDYSTPPSSTPQNPGAEAHDTLNGNTATGAGDPPGFHSYCNLVYDGYNDRLVLFGLPTYFSTNGSSSARIRSLSSLGSSPPLWDAFTARPAKNNQGQGSSSVFDSSSNTIWSKECGSNVGIQRYDCAANTMSTVTDGLGTWSLDQAVACKPGSYIVCIGGFAGLPLDAGGGDMVLFDLTSYGGGSITSYTRTVSVPAALKVAKVGMAYHPPS